MTTVLILCIFIYCVKSGTINKDTWGNVDYEPLLDGIWRTIGIHAHHQQRCENYVQMAALISKTLIGEVRRTWRAIAVSLIIRRFNSRAVERVRAEKETEEEKAKIKRVSGAKRVELYAEFIDDFNLEVEKGNALLGKEGRAKLAESIADKDLKASTAELKALEESFAKALTEDLKQYKDELPKGYTLTPIMGGRVLLRILTKKNGFEDAIDAELVARKIPEEDTEFIKKQGEDADLSSVSIKTKKAALKHHQAKLEAEKNEKISIEEAKDLINSIKPFSDEMEAILAKQNEILDQLK